MRQTPGRRNSRRFPDAHTGRLDAHGRLQDKAGADTASRHDQVFDFLRYQRTVGNFIESALGQLLRNLLPVGVNKPRRTADRIRKTTLVMVVIFHQIMPAANPPGFPGPQHSRLTADERFFKTGQMTDQVIGDMVHHFPSVGHRLAVGNRVSRRKFHRDFGTVHAHHAIFTDNGIGLHILRFFLCDFTAFHAFRHEFFQLVPLLAVHGFGDLKIGRLGFAPVLLQFHCHMPVKPVYINASHFKAERQRLVVSCLFITPFKGYAGRPGEKRIPRAVNKCSGADRSQPCNGLDNTGLNDVTGTQRIYQHRLVEDFHPRLFAHLIIDQGQGFGVVPGLLRHAVKRFNAVLPQPILHFRYIGSIAVRRIGIHKGIHAAQHCQTAQRHAPLDEQRFGSVPGSHNRSSRPRRSAACYAHIYRIQHRDFLT